MLVVADMICGVKARKRTSHREEQDVLLLNIVFFESGSTVLKGRLIRKQHI